MVGASFGARVWARWVVGSLFSEAIWVVELQVAEYFVRTDMVQALAVFADSFEQRESADDVRLDKWPRVAQGIVVVRFGGKVDHDVGITYEFIHELAVADITGHELDLIEHAGKVVRIAGVGEFVYDSNLVIGLIFKRVVYEIGSDEAGTAGDKKFFHDLIIVAHAHSRPL